MAKTVSCKSAKSCYNGNIKPSEEIMSKLQDRRNAVKLSQSQLAAVVGMPVQTLRAYESGRRNMSKCELIVALKLADALGCSPWDLIEDEDKKDIEEA